MSVLAVYSVKGGVGKTSTAVHLAWLAAAEGRRTLIWDLDPQGAATYCFRVREKLAVRGKRIVQRKKSPRATLRATDFEGLDLLPADTSLRKLDRWLAATPKPRRGLARVLKPLRTAYDLIVLDCAPGMSLASDAALTAADALLIPVIPSPLALRTLEHARGRWRKAGVPRRRVWPFFSMVDRRRPRHREIVADPPDGFLKQGIPLSAWVERIGSERAPVNVFAPRTAAAAAYRGLWSEVRERLDR